MNRTDLRERVEEFASLQAAHRALAHSVHPSELAPVREQSRDLLIQLQALSSAFQSGETPADATHLERIDRALAEQTERTRTILARIDFAQLRATIPLLSVQHPEEVSGLTDVLLTGDLENDKNLRTLEYLITMLSTDEQGGRRVVREDPSHVTPRLQRITEARLLGAEPICLVAERVLEDATSEVLQENEIGEIRDRVRRYKEELQGNLLHPRVLTSAVDYNVAMWNRVAGEIDSSRALDTLAESLFVPEATSAAPASTTGPGADTLGSEGFGRLLSSFRRRLAGESSRDGAADRIVRILNTDGLRGEDGDAFAEDEADEATWLIRAAIVLGLLLKQRERVSSGLGALGLEIDVLATDCVDDLVSRMTELAHKRFAESNYGEAFRLSDVKTHSLAEHAATHRRGGPSAEADEASDESSATIGWLARVSHALPSAPVLLAGALIVGVLAVPPLARRNSEVSERNEATRISPFLERGRIDERNGESGFVGQVGPAWNYLGDAERREVAIEIADHFAAQGTDRVILMDDSRSIVAEVSDGEIEQLLLRKRDEEDFDL